MQTVQTASERRGLRKKFFLRVVLPPLVPFLALGFLGYAKMTGLIEGTFLNQLTRSSATTAAKVEREMSIRKTVLVRTGEDIIQIRGEFNSLRDTLKSNRDKCMVAVRRLPDSSDQESNQNEADGFDDVIGNPACEPFLPEFAKIQREEAEGFRVAYTRAVQKGFDTQLRDLNSGEVEKIDDRFGSFRSFFPETGELAVIDNNGAVILKPSGQKDGYIASNGTLGTGKDLPDFIYTADGSKRYVAARHNIKENFWAVAVYDADDQRFLKPSWESAPRLQPADAVYIADTAGNLIYPNVPPAGSRKSVLGSVAGSSKDSIHTFDDGKATVVAGGSQVGGLNWAVLVTSPETALLTKVREVERLALGAVMVSLIVSLLVGLLFVASATRAIKKLREGALAFAVHNLDKQIKVQTNDELQTLAETMNIMAAQIKQAEKALDEKNKEFISVATHELRAPMTAIIGNLSMVIEDGIGHVDEKAREIIRQAYVRTTHLRDLVNDMLDIARFEAGHAQFDIKPVNIIEISKDVLDMQAVAAKEKDVSLAYDGPPAGIKVAADANKLRIILTNFVSNAVKYNRPGGSVTVAHTVDGNLLKTSVADTGLGIPKDQQDKMFQKFFRVDSKEHSAVTGTGLGLYITKQLIEGMGGKLWFESEPGQGTTFFFALPLA